VSGEAWHPGSFTKNFSWGEDRGLRELYDVIKAGFDSRLEDVPRKEFEARVVKSGRPVLVPLNFFLYNRVKSGVDFIIVDELAFQAINFRHSPDFDRLGLFAFLLSRVGFWKKAHDYQREPALWARHYVKDRVGPVFQWNGKLATADDVESFVTSDHRYQAKTSRKLSTNLAHLLKIGRLDDYRSKKAERWWLSALFLALDRATEDLLSEGRVPEESRYEEYLIRSNFHQLAGTRSLEKDLAAHHFIDLYKACGGASRFSEQATLERQRILLPDLLHFANNPEPVGVFHPSNPRARGAIPRACAMLAQYIAKFRWVDLDDLENFDVEAFVKQRTREAVDSLVNDQIGPNVSVDDLLKMTRGE
jgi:hypothetical protein